MKAELKKCIATKNTIRHKTTGHIPLELHRGRLLHRSEDMSVEEEAKVIAYMRAEAVERIKKAAEKSASRWIRNHRVKIYEVGDKVWVRQRIKSQRKGKIWQRTATIHNIKGNHSYRLFWGEQGGYDSAEKPSSISLRFWNGKDLKPRIERSPEPSESDSDLEYEEESDENDGEEDEKNNDNETIAPAISSTPRYAKRKHQEKKKRKEEDKEEQVPAVMTTSSTRGTPIPVTRSLSSFFAERGVENVDRSLSRKAKKARTNK